jgi:hypothetical protein
MHVADAPIPLTTAMIHPRVSLSSPMSPFPRDVGQPSSFRDVDILCQMCLLQGEAV